MSHCYDIPSNYFVLGEGRKISASADQPINNEEDDEDDEEEDDEDEDKWVRKSFSQSTKDAGE